MTFPYLICFILFDIDLLVAAQNFASSNLRNSDFSFVLLKYQAIFSLKFRSKNRLAVNFAKFPSKICENKERNSPNFVCITFAQYCKLSSPSFSTHLNCSFLIFSFSLWTLLCCWEIVILFLTVWQLWLISLNDWSVESNVAQCLLTLPLNFVLLMDTTLLTLVIVAMTASKTSLSLLLSKYRKTYLTL